MMVASFSRQKWPINMNVSIAWLLGFGAQIALLEPDWLERDLKNLGNYKIAPGA